MVQDDDIIELTEVISEEPSPEDRETIAPAQGPPDPEAWLPDDAPLAPGNSEDAMPSLDRSDMEAVLEKLIEKKFSETIEKILFEVMEKVITREIEEIKAGLKRDLDDIGQA